MWEGWGKALPAGCGRDCCASQVCCRQLRSRLSASVGDSAQLMLLIVLVQCSLMFADLFRWAHAYVVLVLYSSARGAAQALPQTPEHKGHKNAWVHFTHCCVAHMVLFSAAVSRSRAFWCHTSTPLFGLSPNARRLRASGCIKLHARCFPLCPWQQMAAKHDTFAVTCTFLVADSPVFVVAGCCQCPLV